MISAKPNRPIATVAKPRPSASSGMLKAMRDAPVSMSDPTIESSKPSTIIAPTGGRPNVIGSSMATVAMVPMPGSTPTSVPTSAPIRHSRMLTGIGIEAPPRKAGVHCTRLKTTPKPSPRFEKRSPIVPSTDHENRQELQRQTERVRKQKSAKRRQAGADDQRFYPPCLRCSACRDQKACHGSEDHSHRPDRDGKRQDRQRHEQRTPPVVFRKVRAFGQNADGGDGSAEAQQQKSEHPRRGAGAERESAHALQVARRPKGEQGDGHQGKAADKILRAADPFRHDRFNRRMARRVVHGYSSPKAGFEPVAWITWMLVPETA